MGNTFRNKKKTAETNIWRPSNQYAPEWETEPKLSIKNANCISTRVEYLSMINKYNVNTEVIKEKEKHTEAQPDTGIVFHAVGSGKLPNIGPTDHNQDFTHIIEATVAIKVLKGNVDNAIIWPNDQDTFISLDCPKCKRVGRSVFFGMDGKANCTGSTGHGDYPGQIIKIESFKMNNIVLATFTILITWEPFTDSKWAERKSETASFQYGRICFDIECKICGKKGKKYRWEYVSYQGNGHHNEEYIKCEHIHCIEYNSDPAQPWITCKKLMINPEILRVLLQDVLLYVFGNELSDMITEYAAGYW